MECGCFHPLYLEYPEQRRNLPPCHLAESEARDWLVAGKIIQHEIVKAMSNQ